MKKGSLIFLFIIAILGSVNAQSSNDIANMRYDLGISFEISSVPGWGYGEPVITDVEPFSPADKAGIKVGDIIMEVNSTATYLRNQPTIYNWLTDNTTSEIRLTIRNLSTYFKDYSIKRRSRDANAISEFSLASAYAFYSLENTSQRAFSIPMRVDPNQDVDFSDYHTFDFVGEDVNATDMDKNINFIIEKALAAKGLTRSSNDPDILVQTYYNYQQNIIYNKAANYNRNQKSWRYDAENKKMIQLPILSAEDPNADTKGQYILELGIRFFDQKYIDKSNLTQIWDCKTRELLTNKFDLQEYARIHAPLMLMQYPYSTSKTIAKYLVSFKGFNYTGLSYDIRDLATIKDIDEGSPASLVGLKRGDIVARINNIRFNYEIPEVESGYRRFILESMPLRDKSTRFIDANGFPDCMYWDKSKYAKVATAFAKESIYVPYFSYLYAFEKYVSGVSGNMPIEMEVKTRGDQKKVVKINPQIQKSIVVKVL